MARVDPNRTTVLLFPKGILEVLNSSEVIAELEVSALLGKAFAETIAPVGEHRRPGDDRYNEKFGTNKTRVDIGGRFPGLRAAVELENTSDHALAVEWGDPIAQPTRKPDHVLGRTLEYLIRAR